MGTKPVVRLWNAYGISVIILHPSGVLYSNQVGELACLAPQVEGVYVPLKDELIHQEELLLNHFTGIKWLGACSNGIDNEDANIIDAILEQSIETKIIKVDRSRLKESCEAWVYINIIAQVEDGLLHGFGTCDGILTWSNSD